MSTLAPKVGPKEHIIPMEISPVPKTIGGGGGLGKTMSVSFVPTPLGGPSVVFVLMHMSGATTEMPNITQPDQCSTYL